MLWGMSNPDERPGEATEFDWAYYDKVRQRMAMLLPVTAGLGLRKAWAATIDFTPDHLPILGPLLTPDGSGRRRDVVAAAGGHGMMWGPGRRAGRRRPRAAPAPPTSSTSPTSASTASTSTAAAGWPPTRSRCPSPERRGCGVRDGRLVRTSLRPGQDERVDGDRAAGMDDQRVHVDGGEHGRRARRRARDTATTASTTASTGERRPDRGGRRAAGRPAASRGQAPRGDRRPPAAAPPPAGRSSSTSVPPAATTTSGPTSGSRSRPRAISDPGRHLALDGHARSQPRRPGRRTPPRRPAASARPRRTPSTSTLCVASGCAVLSTTG